jgi:spermidine/putrescine transport system substrate-binding protein
MNMDESYVREIAERDLQRLSRRMFLARAGGAVLAASGGVTLLSGWSGGARQLAKVGGQLVFVGVDGEDARAIAKPFLKKNHITLKVSYIADNDTLLTKLRTGGDHQFDVMTIPKDSAPREMALGFVQPLSTPSFGGLFPGLQHAPWITHGGKTYGFPLIWGSEPCVYNPKKFTSLPPKYTDFADKKYARSLTTIDEPYGNQWLVAKSLGFGHNGNHNQLTQAQLDKVRDAWIALKKNVVSMTAAFGDQTDLLVRGEASIALNSWQAVVQFAKAKGVTLKYGTPKVDGTYYWSDSYFIASHAPNPDTARAYISYMTSPANNARLADSLQSGCTVAKAVKLLPSNSISGGYPYAVVKDAHMHGDIVKTILPPETSQGSIVGKAAWVKSWEQVKAS